MGVCKYLKNLFPLNRSVNIFSLSLFKALKPVYELFLERRVKEVTTQAVSAATGISRENVETAMGLSRQNSAVANVKRRNVPNGKPKDL